MASLNLHNIILLGAHICTEIRLIPQNVEHWWCPSVQPGPTIFQALHPGRHFDHHGLHGQVRFQSKGTMEIALVINKLSSNLVQLYIF